MRSPVAGDRVGSAARGEPVLGEAGEADLVARVHRAALVDQAHRVRVGAHQIGVARPVGGDDRAAVHAVPGAAAVVGGADHHRPPPVGVGGAGEQQPVAQAQQGALDLRGVQVGQVVEGRREAVAAVAADRLGAVAEVGAVLLPAADQDRAVAALGEGQFGRFLPEGAVVGDGPGVGGADPPVLAVVVAHDQCRVVGGDPAAVRGLGVDPEGQPARVPSAGELDAVHGPGRVPGVPVGGQDLRAQVARHGPAAAVVVAVLQMRGAVAGDRATGAVGTARVVGLREPDPARLAVHDRRRIAVRVTGALVGHLQRAPGAAAVGGALEHDVDVGGVTAVEDPALGERQQGAVGRPHDRRDAEAGVAGVLGRLEEDLLLELGCLGGRLGLCRGAGEEGREGRRHGDGGGECGSETGAKT